MPKKCIQTDAAPRAVGPYAQAVLAESGAFLFVSGQLGIDPATGKMVDGGVLKEADRALQNIQEIVTAAGGSLSNVVKTTVLLSDIADFKQVNEIYGRFFASEPPARAAYQVAALPLGALIEIEAIAII